MQLLTWIIETETGDIQDLNLKGGQKMYFDQRLKLMYQLDMICIITITSNEMHIIFKSESLIMHISLLRPREFNLSTFR